MVANEIRSAKQTRIQGGDNEKHEPIVEGKGANNASIAWIDAPEIHGSCYEWTNESKKSHQHLPKAIHRAQQFGLHRIGNERKN